MKLTPDPTPQGHGIYTLIHRASESIYIGSSTNLRARMIEWRSAFRRGDQKVQRFPSQNHDDYEFRVLKRTEGCTHQELRGAEAEYIEKAKAAGIRVMNVISPAVSMIYTLDGLSGSATFHASRLGKNPSYVINKMRRGYSLAQALSIEPPPPPKQSTFDARAAAINAMPTKLMHNGTPVTYAEAVTLTGKSANGVREKMKRLRKKDPTITTIDVAEL